MVFPRFRDPEAKFQESVENRIKYNKRRAFHAKCKDQCPHQIVRSVDEDESRT